MALGGASRSIHCGGGRWLHPAPGVLQRRASIRGGSSTADTAPPRPVLDSAVEGACRRGLTRGVSGVGIRPPSPEPPMASRTPFHAQHVAAGGKIIEFAGWDMPV